MKNSILRGIALAMALLLAGALAMAEVRTTANVWLRAEPNREGEQITSFPEDTSLDYLGETRYDERPVAWYKVKKGEYTGWVSSKYAELIGEESIVAGSDEWFLSGGMTVENEDGSIEVCNYYRADLLAAATALALPDFRREDNSEVPFQYYDAALTLAGNQSVEYIGIAGAGYTVFGVGVGMAAQEASDKLMAAGLDFTGNGQDTLVFEHRGQENSLYVNEEGHDSCVNLYLENGLVKEIDWSSYTG